MKRFVFCFTFAAIMLLTVECSQNEMANAINTDGITRADEWEIDYSLLDTVYFVGEKDVDAYIHFKKLIAESEKREFEVCEVVTMGEEAVLCYLINYNDGWEIIAADKRAPVVLAHGEKGNFVIEEAPNNMIGWLESLERDVLGLRTSSDCPKGVDEPSWENMLNSINFWTSISGTWNYQSLNFNTGRRMIYNFHSAD